MRLLNANVVVTGSVLGLLLTVATVGVTSNEYFHESRWDPDHPQHLSNYRRVSAWGWPLYWAVDEPWKDRPEKIDIPAELRPMRLVADIVFCTLLVFYVHGLSVLYRRRSRTRQPMAAVLLSPLTVFFVVQLLLPLLYSSPVLHASEQALLASLAAFVALLLLGLPIAWLLSKAGLFKPTVVFGVGALLALVPFAQEFLTLEPFKLSGLLFVALAAASGGLCALTFWAFSSLDQRRRPSNEQCS